MSAQNWRLKAKPLARGPHLSAARGFRGIVIADTKLA
jgi:hypothetical protein